MSYNLNLLNIKNFGGSMKIEDRIKELREYLNYHSYKYYVEDMPEISDYDYDKTYRDLEELEEKRPDLITSDSPTQRIGDKALEKFNKVIHEVQMKSLADVFDFDELKAFDKRINENLNVEAYEYVVEKKIDGLSVSLEYENGIFFRGSTRGDGITGEDVTLNLKTINSIPMKLKYDIEYLEVRGEVFISKKNFEKIVKEQEINEQEKFKNPRNAAAGSIRQLDPKIASNRKLDIYVFNIQSIRGKEFLTHSETLEYLKSQGFKVSPDYRICKNIDNAIEEIDNINKKRSEMSFEIDGAVIKINSLKQREYLGETTKNPKWAVAYKYPAEKKITKILDIYLNVGRTGVLTPNALLESVNIAGTTVRRATLHNIDFIESKDIRIGDTVVVQKAGDIIPEVVEVIKEKRDGSEIKFVMPNKCPKCGAMVEREEGKAAYKCIGSNCPAKLERSIVHFVSRDAMNIEGLGSSIVEILLKENFIESISDLYILENKKQELVVLDRFGEKSVNNLINSINNSKNNNLNRLLFGLGIMHIGSRAAKLIADKFKNIDNIIKATKEDIESIDEFGSVMAESVVSFFNQEENLNIIKDLKEYGVNMKSIKLNDNIDNRFEKLTFVLTGTLENYTRNEAKNIIEKYKGKVSGSLSKKTNFLLVGKDAGSKLEKSKKLGIKIIDEKEFKNMIL
jgi:DNA ligase (NAD+)